MFLYTRALLLTMNYDPQERRDEYQEAFLAMSSVVENAPYIY